MLEPRTALPRGARPHSSLNNYRIPMTAKLSLFLLVFSLLSASSSSAAPGDLAIITPPDKSSVTGELISIVVAPQELKFDKLQILVNGRKQKELKSVPARNALCADGILLSPGVNKIRISAMKGAGKVGEKYLSVMLRVPLSSAWNATPPGFSDFNFHVDDRQKSCAPCHRLDFKNWKEDAGPAEKSPCFVCHKARLSSYRLAHGPAAVWSCVTCHGGSKENPGADNLQADGSSCSVCHDEAAAQWKSQKFPHGPLAMEGCQFCHDAHASDRNSFLKLPVYDLCISCHAEIPAKPHVVSGFSGNGHPLILAQDPFKPGKEFNCVSCHNPHASDTEFLLHVARDQANQKEYCKSCHTF